MQVGGDGLAQRLDAHRRRVAVPAVAQRPYGGLHDVARGGHVGLADPEVDDVAALRRQLGGAVEHRKGVLLAEPGEGREREHAAQATECPGDG